MEKRTKRITKGTEKLYMDDLKDLRFDVDELLKNSNHLIILGSNPLNELKGIYTIINSNYIFEE